MVKNAIENNEDEKAYDDNYEWDINSIHLNMNQKSTVKKDQQKVNEPRPVNVKNYRHDYYTKVEKYHGSEPGKIGKEGSDNP